MKAFSDLMLLSTENGVQFVKHSADKSPKVFLEKNFVACFAK